MWGARHQTVFEIYFMIRIVETFYLHDTSKTLAETSEESTVLNLSGYDLTTSADVIYTQFDTIAGQSTFVLTNSTPHDTEAMLESLGVGDSTWEGLDMTSEVSAELISPTSSVGLLVDSYGKPWNDYAQYDSSTPTTPLTYTDNFENTYVIFEEVTEPENEYFTNCTVYNYSEAVTKEATPDFKGKDESFRTINYDSTTNSTGELPDDMETDATTLAVPEESTFETVTSMLVTTEFYGNVSTGEDKVPTNQMVLPSSKDWHTVTASVVSVCVVCLVVLIFWKLRRSGKSEYFAALGDVDIFYMKPRQPLILKDELMLYALSVHFTKGTRAKILGEDHPVNLSQEQQKLMEEVTSL